MNPPQTLCERVTSVPVAGTEIAEHSPTEALAETVQTVENYMAETGTT